MNLYDLTVPTAIKSLRNLSANLDKGAAFADSKKTPMEVVLNSRLAIDQFPLTRQIQIACDTAKLGAARLTGVTPPTNEDTEKTLPEFQARIKSTIAFLETLKPEQFNGAETRQITNKFWENKWMKGEDYVHHHFLPNLYFHTTTAYAILRHNGVDVGKGDFLGKMPFQTA